MSSEALTEPGVAAAPDSGNGRQRAGLLRTVLTSNAFQGSITFIAFLVIFAIYIVWLGDKFASVDARLLDVHQNAPVLLLGLAVLVTLVAGQFDLSVGSMATLTTYLTIGLAAKDGWSFILVLAVCVAIGLLGGLLNGLLVVKLRVNAFIATLGTGGLFLGFSSVYGKGSQLSPTPDDHPLPAWFTGPDSLGSFAHKFPSWIIWIALAGVAFGTFMAIRRLRPAKQAERTWDVISAAIVIVIAALLVVVLDLGSWVDGVSWTIAVLLAIGFILWVLLNFTTYGRFLRATGSNPEAARLAGVNPGKETIKAFVLGGLLAAVAGIILAANQGAAAPDVAAGYLLPAFAAAFLSTVILSTGRFKVWGTIIGGTFLVWVAQGLIVGGVPFTWTDVINGLVLILAVALSTVFRRTA